MKALSKSEPWWFTDYVLRLHLSEASPYMNGRLLDVGCGGKPYRDLFAVNDYVGLDSVEGPEVDYVGNAEQLSMFADASFDSILCNQVLEHVADFGKAIAEMFRVLRPKGHACITVPFIGRLHGEPHDYWRFSAHGLRHLLSSHGFELVLLKPMGGFWTTQGFLWLFHIHASMRGPMWGRGGRVLIRILNPFCAWLHRRDKERLTPFNYICVARRPDEGCGC